MDVLFLVPSSSLSIATNPRTTLDYVQIARRMYHYECVLFSATLLYLLEIPPSRCHTTGMNSFQRAAIVLKRRMMSKGDTPKNECTVTYSPVYSYSGKSCAYSPDGKHVLFTNGKEVHIVSTETQMVEFNLFCSDRVDYAEWSPNSQLLLCVVKRNNTIEVGLCWIFDLIGLFHHGLGLELRLPK